MSVFVDSSTWYAASDRGDRLNSRAKEALAGTDRLVTSDHVLVETDLLLRSCLGAFASKRFWQALRSGVAAVELVTAADLEVAWQISESFPDQDFSLADCTSFAVMQRLGLREVASFGDHFAVYRFGPGRRHSFTVRR